MLQNREPLAKHSLSQGEAGSRLVIVCAIQFFGVCVFLVPLFIPAIQKEGWQRSCLIFGSLSAACFVLLFFMSLRAAFRHFRNRPFDVRNTELAITITFILNNIALALAMARTGGASGSVYAQAIPMQLSGMLLLAQQRETFTTVRNYWALLYPAVALLCWAVSNIFWYRLASFEGWNTSVLASDRGFGFLSPGLLVSCEIILMAVAYFVPRKFSTGLVPDVAS